MTMTPKIQATTIAKKVGLHPTTKFLPTKGNNNQQNEKEISNKTKYLKTTLPK
jgi:hypothetical protein